MVLATLPTNVASKKSQCIALLVPVLIPAIHILILEKFWSDFNVTVNKEHCTCSCWDTVFKGITPRRTFLCISKPNTYSIIFLREENFVFQVHTKPAWPDTSTCTSTLQTTHSKFGRSLWCARLCCTSVRKTSSGCASTGRYAIT